MAHSNGKITAPINVETDVYAVLGIGPTRIGYDIGYACANTHGKINMWSKYKPVKYNVLNTDAYSSWWKSNDGNCGISFSRISSIENINGANWKYNPPIGGSNSPYRITDFNKYNHNAEPIIKSRFSSSIIEINQFTYGENFIITPDTIVNSSEYNLCLSDVKDLSSFYFSAAIKGPSTNNKWTVYKGGNVVNNYNQGVTINVARLTKGDYQLALFLSNSASVDSGDYYPMPNDTNNKTWLTMRVIFRAPFEFDLTHVARSLNATYQEINELTDYFQMPGSGTLYFRGVFRCIEPASRFIQDTNLRGQSDDHTSGGTYTGAMHNCFYDSNKKQITYFDMSGMKAGDERVIYVKWDGYTGSGGSEPEGGTIADGALSIYYNYGSTSQEIAYVGGSPGFEVEW